MTVRYTIEHCTRYRYTADVVHSWQLLHLQPRPLPHQRLISHNLAIEPAFSHRVDDLDGFGNPVQRLEFECVHRMLAITSHLCLDVSEAAPFDARLADPLPASGEPICAQRTGDEILFTRPFLAASPMVPRDVGVGSLASAPLAAGRPVADAVLELAQTIHTQFRYAPGQTHVATPLHEVIAKRAGVCQDFAHLMIACLRRRGIPARYVSGYLRTEPPPGMARLVGVDATHAWVSAWCPPLGWLDVDPTNGVWASGSHITVAWGRDFGDVSPLRGVILGGANQGLEVAVTVRPDDLVS